MKGTIVGSYRILGTLGVGGMGTVYRGEHTLIGRLAAVKILHPELCANRDIVNRFFNEARATSSIKHPGIVEVFDFGYMASGHAYLIMELLEGVPLSHRVRTRGAIPEGEAAVLLRSVCIALSAAHDKGVVHRDLKPDNIFVIPDPESVLGERTKLLDFGIAKLTDLGLAGTATKTGAVLGTPTYMSPEQCRGSGDVDTRADLYSIGCLFYQLVAGRPPFVNTGAGEVIGSHLFVEPEPPSRHIAAVSPETEALIMKLLAKQPEQRVQSAKELAQLLAGIALRDGWLTAGDVSRPSLNHVAVVRPSPTRGHGGDPGTPAATPVSSIVTTVPGAQPTTPDDATPTPWTPSAKPTTLSGAASEARDAPRRARRRLGLAIAGGLVTAAGGIAALLAFGGPPERHTTRPTAAARPADPEYEAAPVTAPVTEPATSPPNGAPSAPPVLAVEPTAAPPSGAPLPSIPATSPPASLPATSPPASRSATDAPRSRAAATSTAAQSATPATITTPETPLPTPRPAGKPTRKSRKPDKAGSDSDRKELLEQDI